MRRIARTTLLVFPLAAARRADVYIEVRPEQAAVPASRSRLAARAAPDMRPS
jgi:hypothetical protein